MYGDIIKKSHSMITFMDEVLKRHEALYSKYSSGNSFSIEACNQYLLSVTNRSVTFRVNHGNIVIATVRPIKVAKEWAAAMSNYSSLYTGEIELGSYSPVIKTELSEGAESLIDFYSGLLKVDDKIVSYRSEDDLRELLFNTDMGNEYSYQVTYEMFLEMVQLYERFSTVFNQERSKEHYGYGYDYLLSVYGSWDFSTESLEETLYKFDEIIKW